MYHYTQHYAQLSNGLQPPALIIKKHCMRTVCELISHRAANDTALTTVSSLERTSLIVPAGEATQSAAIN